MAFQHKSVIGKKITTGIGRLSFPNLAAPSKHQYSLNKYTATQLVPKTQIATVWGTLKEECLRVAKEAFPDTDLAKIKWPWDDGDKRLDKKGKPYDGHAGCMYITPKQNAKKADGTDNRAPECIAPDGRTTLDPKFFYPGCLVRLRVAPFSWEKMEVVTIERPDGSRVQEKETRRGISLFLNGVQFAGDADKLKGSGDGSGGGFDAIEGVATPTAPAAASTPAATPAASAPASDIW